MMSPEEVDKLFGYFPPEETNKKNTPKISVRCRGAELEHSLWIEEKNFYKQRDKEITKKNIERFKELIDFVTKLATVRISYEEEKDFSL